MPTPSPTTAAQLRFARLRMEFHGLLASSLVERGARLDTLAVEEPGLASELHTLLAALDESDLAPSRLEDPRGQCFGPYRIEAQIGCGGMGVVYRAVRVDGAFEQEVALKLLPAGSRSRELAQRFLRERKILARMAHPNIARLLDGGVSADGRPWLAMEYVHGQALVRYCVEGRLPLRARIDLMIELCGAVAYAHAQLVVHRDIKPSNVLVDHEGRARLLDFGIARLQDDAEHSATLTSSQALTPRYAAPEQLRGERATTAADIHALGIVLRELVEAEPVAAPAAGELARVIAKATAAEPGARYASAAMLADDLHDWSEQRPLRSGIGSPRARLLSLWTHHRWTWLALGGVLLALLLGAGLTLRQARIAEREAQIARTNLQALLDVLAAASPEVYAGRDPKASEFLIEAARRLQAEYAHDPLLIWRSHSQIGVGLINLGHFDEAAPLLRTAVNALDRTRPRELTRELDTLRYQVIAQRGSADAAAIRGVGDRILATASLPDAPAGPAISALASAANTLSRLGEFVPALPWLARADELRMHAPDLPAEALENYYRQRGWVGLRRLALDSAQADLQRSLAVIDAHPKQFAALRRAEAEQLLAEVALLRADGPAAQAHLQRADAAIDAEYPSGHLERAVQQLMKARAALLSAAPDQAAALAVLAEPVLLAAQTADAGASSDIQLAHAVRVAAAAMRGDCPGAAGAHERGSAESPIPSRRRAMQQVLELIAARCTDES